MFETRIANVVAYGGLALLLLIPASQFLPSVFENRGSTAPAAALESTTTEKEELAAASAVPIEQPAAVPTPAGEVLRPGQRIQMTDEQIRGPSDPASAQPTAEVANVQSETSVIPPIPRPRPQHQATRVAVPKPAARAPTPRVEVREPIVFGEPERVLGTLPAQDYPVTPPLPVGNAVQTMTGWSDGSLEEYLERQRNGEGRPDDRFVPPANVGY